MRGGVPIDSCGIDFDRSIKRGREETGFGRATAGVLSKCDIISHTTLAVGLCFGVFVQHVSAKSHTASDS